MGNIITEKLLAALNFGGIRDRYLEILEESRILVDEIFEVEYIVENINSKLKSLNVNYSSDNRAHSISLGSHGDILNQALKYLSMGHCEHSEKYKEEITQHINESYIIDMLNKTHVFQLLSNAKQKDILTFLSAPEFLVSAVNSNDKLGYDAQVKDIIEDIRNTVIKVMSVIMVESNSKGLMPLQLVKAFDVNDFWVHDITTYEASPMNSLYYLMTLVGFIDDNNDSYGKNYFDGLNYKDMETENQFLKFKIYKNGNAKVWIKPPLSLKPVVDFCVS